MGRGRDGEMRAFALRYVQPSQNSNPVKTKHSAAAGQKCASQKKDGNFDVVVSWSKSRTTAVTIYEVWTMVPSDAHQKYFGMNGIIHIMN